jgi:hypothetical protein
MEEDKHGMTYNMNIREVHTLFWVGKLKGRDHLEDLDVSGRITFKCM